MSSRWGIVDHVLRGWLAAVLLLVMLFVVLVMVMLFVVLLFMVLWFVVLLFLMVAAVLLLPMLRCRAVCLHHTRPCGCGSVCRAVAAIVLMRRGCVTTGCGVAVEIASNGPA